MQYPIVWAEVDLKTIAHNVRELRRITSPDSRLMAVVKANAYGHGLIEVAGKALESGAQALGVARASEGIQLRKAGFDAPILVFSYTAPGLAKELVEFGLTQTVYSYKTAKALSAAVSSSGKRIRVHLKVDTGMGRLGVLPDCFRISQSSRDLDNAVHEVESIARLKNLELTAYIPTLPLPTARTALIPKISLKYLWTLLNSLNAKVWNFLSGMPPTARRQ